MKVCSKCGIEKTLDCFFVKDKKIGKLHAQCKDCYKEYRKTIYKAHYYKYQKEYLARAKIRRTTIQKMLRGKMLEYLTDKECEQCGMNDMRVLDFDHVDPDTKSFSISKGLTDGYHWEKLLGEIQKCRILCSNCHRIRTAEANGWYRPGPNSLLQ